MKPKIRVPNQHTRKSIIRDMRESNKASLDRYFAGIDWSCVTDQTTCEGKLQVFTDIVANGLSNIMPERTIKIYPKDAPWMSVKLKKLIHMRQHAFHANKCGLAYKFYRNAVNRERKLCRAKYCASKVKDLKGVNPRQWWNEVRKLSGSEKQNSSLLSCLNVPEYSNMATTADVANAINNALLSPLQDYEPISEFTETVALEENPEFLELPTHRVYNNLKHLNKFKAPGPDRLSNWVLKEYAVFLAQPVCDILNASYKEQKLPSVWKLADVTPLPKVDQASVRPQERTPSNFPDSRPLKDRRGLHCF